MASLANNQYLIALLYLALFASTFLMLGKIIRTLQHEAESQRSVVDRINALLPQTQCGQCGHPGCRPYARAISEGAAINQCPPGGNRTIINLAALLNELPQTLNPAHGEIHDYKLAFIREDECIGCTKCIQACPVDAILGGPKLMHTVIARECTGCDLCVEPCPVDCIDMLTVDSELPTPRWQLPSRARSPINALDSANSFNSLNSSTATS